MRSHALLAIGLGYCVLQKLEMDVEYEENVEATGEDYSVKLVDIMGEIIGCLSSLRLVILL